MPVTARRSARRASVPAQDAQRVCNRQQRYPDVRYDGNPHGDDSERPGYQNHSFGAQGKGDVLPHNPGGSPGDVERINQTRGLVCCNDQIPRLYRRVGAKPAHGNSDIRRGQHGGVVHAVTDKDHGTVWIRDSQLLYSGYFVFRQLFAADIFYSARRPYCMSRLRMIAGKQRKTLYAGRSERG